MAQTLAGFNQGWLIEKISPDVECADKQRGVPLHFAVEGWDARIREQFGLIDRVEVEFYYLLPQTQMGLQP